MAVSGKYLQQPEQKRRRLSNGSFGEALLDDDDDDQTVRLSEDGGYLTALSAKDCLMMDDRADAENDWIQLPDAATTEMKCLFITCCWLVTRSHVTWSILVVV